MLATRSKWGLEDSKRIYKTIKFARIFFFNYNNIFLNIIIFSTNLFYFLKIIWNVWKKIIKNQSKKKLCLGGSTPLKPLFVGRFATNTPHGAPPQTPAVFGWTPLANWWSGFTGYRFWIKFAKICRSQFTKNFEYKIDYI